jgi:glutamate/tyrosine decarboxylase-like PLP-dependent enzyme
MGLLGTRPGAAVLSVYACLRALGFSGYQREVFELWQKRAHLLGKLAALGCKLAFAPDLLIVGLHLTNVAAIADELERQGLIVSVSRRFDFLRIVVQRHLSTSDLDLLADKIVLVSTNTGLRLCA